MTESITKEVLNRQQAWNMVNQCIPVNRLIREKRQDCKAWKDYERHNTFVYDFGDRFEIHLSNSEIITINIKQATTLEEYAEYEASTITIRSYDKIGNSDDITRNSTEEEKQILKRIILGALSAIRGGKNKQDAMDVAEYISHHFFEETEERRVNCYNSVYCKIGSCPDSLLEIR